MSLSTYLNPTAKHFNHADSEIENYSVTVNSLSGLEVVGIGMKTRAKSALRIICRSLNFNPPRASTPIPGRVQANQNDSVNCTTTSAATPRTRQIKNQEKQYQQFWECSTCDFKTASSKFRLRAHEAIHTGERPFKCEEKGCNFSATQLGNLKTHERTHTGQKPYKCSECSFTATQASHIRQHKGRTHDKGKTLLKKCKYCDFETRENAHLNTHVISHTGIKPFKCQLCPFSSAEAAGIRRHHQRDHEENKSLLACRLCRFRTNKWMNLKLHVARAHKPKEIFVNPKSSPKVVSELFRSVEANNRRRCSRPWPYAPKRADRKVKSKANSNLVVNAAFDQELVSPAPVSVRVQLSDSVPVVALNRHEIVFACEWCDYQCTDFDKCVRHAKNHTALQND